MMIAYDPPEHSRLRRIVAGRFTPRKLAQWEARMDQLAAELLDPLVGAGTVDLVDTLSGPYPVGVIAEMMDIPADRRADFKRWSDSIISGISGPGREKPLELGILDSMAELMVFLRETIRERRASPGEDLISLLVDPGKGHALGDAEAASFVILLLVAGNETTTNLIGNGINALYDHPDQLALLLEDPTRMNGFIEEALRFDPPIQIVFRRATRDCEIAGVPIAQGAYVAPMLASANRDERKFPDAERFDIQRDSSGQLGFGFGLHFCLGSALARLQARAALEAVVPHLSRLRRRDEVPAIIDSFLIRGRSSLVLQEPESA